MNFFKNLILSIQGKLSWAKKPLSQQKTAKKSREKKHPNFSDTTQISTHIDTTAPTSLLQRKKRVIKTKVKKIKFNYSIAIIPELLQVHQDILKQMSSLDNAAYEKSIHLAFENLQGLIDMLDAKISLEKSKLYPYLQKTLINNIDNYTAMRNFRKETDKLASIIDMLATKYNLLTQNPDLINSLEEDVTKLSAFLIDHIREVELRLYPLYQPGN